jgi:hypothetical protein
MFCSLNTTNTTTQLLINAWGRHQLILKSQQAEQDLLKVNSTLSQQAFQVALIELPNRRALSANKQAQRLLQDLLDAKIPHAPSSQQTCLSISINIALFRPSQHYKNIHLNQCC